MKEYKKYVLQLYSRSWYEYQLKVREVVTNLDDANELVEILVEKDKGWRDRVTAAKIIATYNLIDYIPTLINNFKQSPDYHMSIALSELIKEVYGQSGINYLLNMKESCSRNDYGKVMKDTINEYIEELKNA